MNQQMRVGTSRSEFDHLLILWKFSHRVGLLVLLNLDEPALTGQEAFAISLLLKANTETESNKPKIPSQSDQANLHLDSILYRENIPDNISETHTSILIENEHSPVNRELLESSRSEYLSYKSSNYYEIKNNVRKNNYFKTNRQCVLASLPGVLDIFVDSISTRIIVKLHLSDKHGNHQFKLFRSRGALGRHLWKHLVVQVDKTVLQIFLDSVLDTRVDLAEYGVWFGEYAENADVPEGIDLFRHANSRQFKHNGLILGNVDRMSVKDNFDELKFGRVYETYKSKSLLDRTNQEYFQETTKVAPPLA